MPESQAKTAPKIVDLLHAERKRLGRSLETLAVAADASNSCVQHLEHGRATLTFVMLFKRSEVLQLDLAGLLRAAQQAVRRENLNRRC